MKVLGVHWCPKRDQFCFKVDMNKLVFPARTPRQLVSIQCSLYDPNGFVSPFIWLGRRMLQKATAGGRGWDSPLDPKLLEQFYVWTSSIPLLENYPIKRWWETNETMDSQDISWHFFSDASLEGYGVVVYRRVVGPVVPPLVHGKIHVSLIMSRSHVVPLDSSKASHHGSMPRLETVANTKSVKTRTFLTKIFGKLGRVLHHSDSEPSLK